MRLRILTALAAVLLTTACTGTDDDDPAAGVDELDGVASVEEVLFAGEASETYLRVTLDEGLSEADARAAVDRVKDHYDDTDADPGSLEVDVDGFRGHVYPRHVGDSIDPDLERALWLREDGRALSSGPGPHFRPGRLSRSGAGFLAVVPATDVVDVALGMEEAVPTTDEVRRTYAVGSPDGTMRVQWSNYPSDLDRAALTAFGDVQDALPGTTGWYDDQQGGAGVWADDADLPLADWLRRGPGLVAGLQVDEVGWGPLRSETFRGLRDRARRLGPDLDRLLALPGLSAVTDERVEVTDLATFDAVRRLLPDETVALVREPSDLIGFAPDAVVEASSYTSTRVLTALRTFAGIDGVRQLSGSLVLESDVTDAALAEVMALLRSYDIPDYGVPVQVGEAPIMRVSAAPVVARLTDAGARAEPSPTLPVAPSLTERIVAAWEAPAG